MDTIYAKATIINKNLGSFMLLELVFTTFPDTELIIIPTIAPLKKLAILTGALISIGKDIDKLRNTIGNVDIITEKFKLSTILIPNKLTIHK